MLAAEGIVDRHVLIDALFESLGQPIDAMLASRHPLIRALAVIDGRFGRRRLDATDTRRNTDRSRARLRWERRADAGKVH